MTVYVLTMNWKLKCFKEASKSSRFRISFKFITMHKLTARIIQCIVPHKLIVLDLLNFCYHKLHVQFHRGVLSRVSACQYLLPLMPLTFKAVCLHQSSPKFAVQVPVLVRHFGECLQATALLNTPRVKVYSKLSPCLFEMTMD